MMMMMALTAMRDHDDDGSPWPSVRVSVLRDQYAIVRCDRILVELLVIVNQEWSLGPHNRNQLFEEILQSAVTILHLQLLSAKYL